MLYGQQYEGLRDLDFVKVEAAVCNGSRTLFGWADLKPVEQRFY